MKCIFPFLLIAFSSCFAQTKDYSNDVTTVDATIASLYDVISGAPGVARDWDRFRNLFHPEARLIPTRLSPEGTVTLHTLRPEEYVQQFGVRVSKGFFERELHRTTEQYGTIVHVFSTYETKEKHDGPVTNRGINSIQLFFDGKRYSIIDIYWCAEGLGFPLPEKYVK